LVIWSRGLAVATLHLHREIELLLIHLREEAFLPLFLIMLGRWRKAGKVLLPLNLQKIYFQDLPSFLYASKRYSSIRSYWLFTPVLKPYSSSLKHPLSSLLRLRSLLLKLLLLSLLDSLLLCDAKALAYVALPCLSRVHVPSL